MVVKIKNILLYFISLILIFFYVMVLYLGKNPNVSIEYKMYYIDRTLKYWPQDNGLAVKLDKIEYLSNKSEDRTRRISNKGFLTSEETGTWTEGLNSSIFWTTFSQDCPNYSFCFDVVGYMPDVKFSVFVNNIEISRNIAAENKTYSFNFSSEVLNPVLNNIRIETKNPVSPAALGISKDKKVLGIHISRLWFEGTGNGKK